MKNKKKLLALLLVLVMAVSLFGCATNLKQAPVPLAPAPNNGKSADDATPAPGDVAKDAVANSVTDGGQL